jgi:hypothetical protein
MTTKKNANTMVLQGLLSALSEGERKAKDDEMVFGTALDAIADEASSEIVEARDQLERIMRLLFQNPTSRNLPRALGSLSGSLHLALYNIGRYRANPMHRMGSRKPSAMRVVGRWLKERGTPLP